MNWRYRVPGRVELVGKHTDYAGGPSVTCATPFHMHASAKASDAPVVQVHDQRSKSTVELPLSAETQPLHARWTVYLAAVVRRIARDFPAARRGVDITLGSTVPTSMGMSSSSALVVTVASAVFDANGLWNSDAWNAVAADELAFAQYCAAMESGAAWGPFAGDTGVGTRGGAQDHIAICASRRQAIGQYSYLPGHVVARVAWPSDWRIVVATSGVKATKTGNAMHAYNRVADSVRAIVAAWNAATGRDDATLSEAIDADASAFDELLALAPRVATAHADEDYLRGRVQQYREETREVVPQFVDAVTRADADAAAAAMDRSQAMAESRLMNQVPETVWLAAHARDHGAFAATAFGAGFGGAVWALVHADAAESFAASWMDAFAAQHGGAGKHEAARVLTPSAGLWRGAE